MRKLLLVSATVFLTGATLARPAAAVDGQTFVVTSTSDSGGGTLRAAIVAADTNANAPAIDHIVFNLTGNGPFTIGLNGPLPSLSEPVVVDGYTQGDATPGTPADDARPNDEPSGSSNAVLKISLSGATAGPAFGITIDAPNTTVRGLNIHSFSGAGILLNQGAGTRIEGNFIGTSIDGGSALANGGGIAVNEPFGTGATIGGTSPAARNIISGNTGNGIEFASTGDRDVTIQGNLIGVATDGTSALPNTVDGILLRNTPKSRILIGGTTAAAGNVIADNGARGVDIEFGGSGTRVLSNSIFDNGALGIDLDGDGVTTNDHKDGDGGTNHLQNFPVITSASDSGTVLTVSGTLDSRPNHKYLLQFFGLANNDGSNHGEGDRFFGQKTVTTNDKGKASFHASFAHPSPGAGYASATATDLSTKDTSEFSQDVFIP
jgi:hypothetical protein